MVHMNLCKDYIPVNVRKLDKNRIFLILMCYREFSS